jgi:hypothetical protein
LIFWSNFAFFDVFRAFSSACYFFGNGAEMIIPVGDISKAYKLKKDFPDFILVGEREGKKPEGFDYGNSPSQIENVDFTGKTTLTYYIECDNAGTVAIYTTHDTARTNLNTVVWNGSGFDSVTTANRTELFGTSDLVALNGRVGGQIIYGDTAASGNLILEPTYHSTKGYIVIGTGVAGIDYAIKFNGETSDGIFTWKEDEDYF